MRAGFVSIFVLILSITETFAADIYQILPLFSAQGVVGGVLLNTHAALFVNVETGATTHCFVRYNSAPRSGDQIFPFRGCAKSEVQVGSMPPGQATLAALSKTPPPNDTRLPAIWKIDQSNGRVTFCGAKSWGFDLGTLMWQCIVLN